MKITKLVLLIVMIALALFLILPNLSWAADDGAALYKTKCAACHGVDLAVPELVPDLGVLVDREVLLGGAGMARPSRPGRFSP